MKKKNFIDKLIFRVTKKPECYKRVKDPPQTTMQKLLHPRKARQQQYNDWCVRYGVYCGSYLPEDPNALLKKGWDETTHPNNKTGKHRDFQRKSSKQTVRYDDKTNKKGRVEDEHYHWNNASSIQGMRSLSNDKKYIDRYGNVCAKGSPESHLAPKDKNFNYRK